jgi:hypothetical protein
MTILNHATGAERERGLVWASDFPSASVIVNDGGAITGTPTFDDGIEFDGSTDYIVYNNFITSTLEDDVSVVIRFTPHFEATDDVNACLVDTTSGTGLRVNKQPNSGSNVLRLLVSGTIIASIPSATYAAYWNKDEENIFVMASTSSGDTSAWLNGTQILTNDGTSWTASSPTDLFVGALFNGSIFFDGTIHSLKIFNTQLTDQEAEDYSNNSVYDYMSSCVLNTPLNIATYDPTNSRALDISSNGLNAAFGATTAAPTKNTYETGYTFDGSDDYMQIPNNSILNFDYNEDFSIAIWAKFPATQTDLASTNNMIVEKWEGSGAYPYVFRINNSTHGNPNKIQFARYDGTNNPSATSTATFNDNQWHLIIGSKRGSDLFLYIDGIQHGTATDTTTTTTTNADDVFVGRRGGGAAYITGNLGAFRVFNLGLTQLQAMDMTVSERYEVSKA